MTFGVKQANTLCHSDDRRTSKKHLDLKKQVNIQIILARLI